MTRYGLMLFTDAFGDGASSDQVFDWALHYVDEAERGGWDDVWTTEHHFTKVVQCSSAVTMAAFLLGRTRLGVGTAVAILPNHHPVALAEQSALLDHLSGGRFTMGVGRGQPLSDQDIFGTGLSGYRDIEEPAHLLVSSLRTGKAHGHGPRFTFDEVDVVPDVPRRAPLAISAASIASARLAGTLGVPVILAPSLNLSDKQALLHEHHCAAAESGFLVSPTDNIDSCYFAIDDDTAVARRRLLHGVRNMLTRGAPGTRPLLTAPTMDLDTADKAARATVENSVVGSPADCVEQLRHREELLGVGRVILMPEAGGSYDATLRAIQRAGPEVFAPRRSGVEPS
jgi:alkanesulfonate monooxygenase SsuD/methylene tetrahydromethanopterin reductase-like flavin-dependent oxidoreductase (luciferase family)